MSSTYSVTISMSAADVQSLSGMGALLCLVKQVEASVNGYPVVWLGTVHYGESTQVQWSDDYAVYDTQNFTSAADLGSTTSLVIVSNTQPTNLGQGWDIVNTNNGLLVQDTTEPVPPADAVALFNKAGNTWTTGLMQSIEDEGSYNAVCSISLLNNFNAQIKPIEKVLLCFAAGSIQTGTILTAGYADGLLVDFSTNANQTVTYSVANEWSANTGSQFVQVPAAQVVTTMYQLGTPS